MTVCGWQKNVKHFENRRLRVIKEFLFDIASQIPYIFNNRKINSSVVNHSKSSCDTEIAKSFHGGTNQVAKKIHRVARSEKSGVLLISRFTGMFSDL